MACYSKEKYCVAKKGLTVFDADENAGGIAGTGERDWGSSSQHKNKLARCQWMFPRALLYLTGVTGTEIRMAARGSMNVIICQVPITIQPIAEGPCRIISLIVLQLSFFSEGRFGIKSCFFT